MFQSFAKYALDLAPVIPTPGDTVLLVHMDGGDGDTTFVDSSGQGHVITAVGAAQKDQAFTPFLGQGALQASLLTVATQINRLTVANSPDWNFGTGDFTIDMWLRVTSNPGTPRSPFVLGSFVDGIYAEFTSVPSIDTYFNSNFTRATVLPTIGIWEHWAWVREAGTFTLYVDGVVQLTETRTEDINPAGNVDIAGIPAGQGMGGNMDEFRITKGSALFTAEFMPPRAPDGVTDYFGHSVVFDGATSLARGANLDGLIDGKAGTLSYWVKFNGDDGVEQSITENDGAFFNSRKLVDNTIKVQGFNGGEILLLPSNSTFTVASGWVHVLASWDLANGLGHLYIDNVSDLGTPVLTDDTIDYARADWLVGVNSALTFDLNADMADLWFDDNFIDITDDAERAKFINATTLLPVDLGDDGQLPTGTTPILSLNKSTTGGWEDNRGSGGGMTVTGALADGSEIA